MLLPVVCRLCDFSASSVLNWSKIRLPWAFSGANLDTLGRANRPLGRARRGATRQKPEPDQVVRRFAPNEERFGARLDPSAGVPAMGIMRLDG